MPAGKGRHPFSSSVGGGAGGAGAAVARKTVVMAVEVTGLVEDLKAVEVILEVVGVGDWVRFVVGAREVVVGIRSVDEVRGRVCSKPSY